MVEIGLTGRLPVAFPRLVADVRHDEALGHHDAPVVGVSVP